MTVLLCGLLFLIQGCGTVVGPGKVIVIVKGDGSSLKIFAENATRTCDRIVPDWAEGDDPKHSDFEKVVVQLAYECDPAVLKGTTPSPLQKFGWAYSQALPGHATGDKDAEPAHLEMKMTTNALCYKCTCYGGSALLWRIPCAYKCQ
jgi:hypothetical protein